MSLNTLQHNEDPGYAADLEDSLEPHRVIRKRYSHRRIYNRHSRTFQLDSSSDSGESLESGIALSRCSSPSTDTCIGCHRSLDRCRCRLKCRGRHAQYMLWKRDLSRSFEVQFNSVELPEAISGNYTPSLWHSEMQQRFNRMFNFQHVQQQQQSFSVRYQSYMQPHLVPMPYYVGWQVNQYGHLQPVGWFPSFQMPPVQHRFPLACPYHPIVHY